MREICDQWEKNREASRRLLFTEIGYNEQTISILLKGFKMMININGVMPMCSPH